MKTKICIKCSIEFELNEKYFYKRKSSKDGFYNKCKVCMSSYDKQYQEKNKEDLEKYRKEYRENNKGNLLNSKKEYYKENKELIVEKNKKRYEINKKSILEYKKQYYKNNLEKIKKYQIENGTEIYRRYLHKNHEKLRNNSQKRRSKKLKLVHDLTQLQWCETKEYFNNKCCYCGQEKPLEQEHFVPISNNGEYTKHNIIPACRSCNSSKGNKDFSAWYLNQVFYSKLREQKILNFIKL